MTYTQVKYNAVPMITMSQTQIETFRIEAVKSVLGSLGDDLLSIIKERLYHDYKITLTENSLFALEELYIALSRLLGESSAHLIMREIHFQIHELANKKVTPALFDQAHLLA